MQRKMKELRVLKNKIVLITGGSSGIGKDLALEAASRGAIVIIAARNKEELDKVAHQCMMYSGRPAFAYQLDVTDPDQVDAVLSQVQHEVGNIDVLVNSAGLGEMVPVKKQSHQSMAKIVNVNLLALMYLSRCVARAMMNQGYGAIINIASLAGKVPTPNSAVYSATKAAVIQFSNVLRMEVADYGVQVLVVNPGPIDTKFWDNADPDASYLKHLPSSMMISPVRLAQQIWDNVGYKTREINVPGYVTIFGWFYQAFPGLGDWAVKKFFDFQQNKKIL